MEALGLSKFVSDSVLGPNHITINYHVCGGPKVATPNRDNVNKRYVCVFDGHFRYLRSVMTKILFNKICLFLLHYYRA